MWLGTTVGSDKNAHRFVSLLEKEFLKEKKTPAVPGMKYDFRQAVRKAAIESSPSVHLPGERSCGPGNPVGQCSFDENATNEGDGQGIMGDCTPYCLKYPWDPKCQDQCIPGQIPCFVRATALLSTCSTCWCESFFQIFYLTVHSLKLCCSCKAGLVRTRVACTLVYGKNGDCGATRTVTLCCVPVLHQCPLVSFANHILHSCCTYCNCLLGTFFSLIDSFFRAYMGFWRLSLIVGHFGAPCFVHAGGKTIDPSDGTYGHNGHTAPFSLPPKPWPLRCDDPSTGASNHSHLDSPGGRRSITHRRRCQ